MIVECYGLPKAGKTTLVSHLTGTGSYHTVPPYVGKHYALLFLCKHFLLCLRYTWAVFHESARTRTWSLGRFKYAVFVNTVGRIEYVRWHHGPDDIVVLDEGFTQRLLSLYETRVTADTYRLFLSSYGASDLVVIVADPNQGVDGIRIGSMRRTFGEQYGKEWQGIISHNYKSILEALEISGISQCYYERTDKGEDQGYGIVSACIKNAKKQ